MARTIDPAQLLADAAWLRRLAARVAGAHGFITELTDGYDAVVGELGHFPLRDVSAHAEVL